jgi:pimeloyl-ACP methyl ester carboxylesterase
LNKSIIAEIIRRVSLFLLLILSCQILFALKPVRKYPYRPEYFGLMYKEFKVKTEDKVKLNVWFFPAQDTVRWGSLWKSPKNWKNPKRRKYAVDNQKRPTIILCSPDALNMAPMAQFAYYMCNHGYNVVTFDWRGFGGSGRWPINHDFLCYPEFFKDIDAVVDTVKTFPEVDSKNIGIYGASMGAFVSFPVFQQKKDLKCFVGRAISADFEGIRDYWANNSKKPPLKLPSDYKTDYYPINIADKVNKPCLFITGELDKITPPEGARAVYSKLKGEKEFWLVKDVGHGVEGAPSVGLQNYIKRMLVFFDKYLK